MKSADSIKLENSSDHDLLVNSEVETCRRCNLCSCRGYTWKQLKNDNET